MTEAEWSRCGDPKAMVEHLRGKALDRSLRLFAYACCRRIEYLVTAAELTDVLQTVKRFAHCRATDAERSAARRLAQQAAQGRDVTSSPTRPKYLRRAASAVSWAAAEDAYQAARRAPELVVQAIILSQDRESFEAESRVMGAEQYRQAAIARGVFGNPFRPSRFHAGWRTPTALGIAQAIHADRALDRLPILADALQDAGCEDADILGHLRGDGPHVRGCWALDLVLERE